MDRLTRIIEDGPISVLSVCQARVEDVAIWKEWSVSKDSSIEEALLRLASYEDLGPVEELVALKEAAERIVLMWDNCYIEPYSADVKDYIERMRKAIKEADNDESGN